MIKPVALIRTDGNIEIGYGHVMRMMALAKCISEDFSVCFLIKNSTEWIKKEISSEYDFIKIPDDIELQNEAEYISKNLPKGSVIIILDGYHFDTDYQISIKQNLNLRSISIDDFQPFKYVTDAVINHAGFLKLEQFSIEANTKLYIGPKYALLRSEYNSSASGPARKIDQIKTAFISLGGTDPDIYSTIISKLYNNGISRFKIVVNNLEKFKNIQQQFSGINLYSNLSASEMIGLMKESNIAVLPSSTLSYEYCSVGGGLFVIQTAENQKSIHNFLLQSGCAFDFNNFHEVIQPDGLSKINKSVLAQKQYFDGKNEKQLNKVVFQTAYEEKFHLRKADENDLMLFFEWANDPETRQNSFNKDQITLETHKNWFLNKINSDNSVLYVLEAGNLELGNIRFEFADKNALLSYSIDKKYRGKGLGSNILKLGIDAIQNNFNEINQISGFVHKHNNPSVSSFNKAGFIINSKPPVLYNDYTYYSLYL